MESNGEFLPRLESKWRDSSTCTDELTRNCKDKRNKGLTFTLIQNRRITYNLTQQSTFKDRMLQNTYFRCQQWRPSTGFSHYDELLPGNRQKKKTALRPAMNDLSRNTAAENCYLRANFCGFFFFVDKSGQKLLRLSSQTITCSGNFDRTLLYLYVVRRLFIFS